ncbi:18628_t:CDS:2, partial [Gigaspora margarita]
QMAITRIQKILSATDKEDNEYSTMIDAFKLTSNLIRMISKMLTKQAKQIDLLQSEN